MQLTVSSSLEGRDLALLKSVINILHSDYAEENDYNWFYSDDSQHQIFIAQDFFQNGSEYYALIKDQGTRVNIGTQINPKNLRKLFEQLAEGNLTESIDKDSTAISKDKASLLKHIYRYMSSQVLIKMQLTGPSGCRIIIDKQADDIVSNVPLNPSMVQNQLFQCEVNIGYLDSKKEIDDASLKFKSKASHFLWNLGLMQSEQLLLNEFEAPHVRFKQTRWPDYGCVKFKNSFITMSALLWRRAESFQSLKQNHEFNEQEIISFLNAMSLSATCIISTSKENKVLPLAKKAQKPSGFLSRLKQKLFGKSA